VAWQARQLYFFASASEASALPALASSPAETNKQVTRVFTISPLESIEVACGRMLPQLMHLTKETVRCKKESTP
jgi:hypothetical protein